jgi:hypothetical protein
MSYRLRYEDGRSGTPRSESFGTEAEALARAREVLETDADCAAAIVDEAGEAVAGVRLQLKLGYPVD